MRTIQGVNCLVTGGAGFIASHVVDHLVNDRQCNVVVVDNLSSGRREFVNHKATFVHHDITGSEHYLCGLMKHHKIDYVLHYAAHPYIPDSFERPLYVADTNSMGSLKVMNAAQEAGVKGILCISSAEIYGSATEDNVGQGIDENFPVVPHSTYGASKSFIDSLIQVRWKEAKTPCIALRQFNVCGPRETHDYVIPTIISQIHSKGTCPLGIKLGSKVSIDLGNNSERDFQYVEDAAKMAVELLEKGELGSVYNMGSEDSTYIYDLAKLIGRLMGYEVGIEVDQSRVRCWEIWKLKSNNKKLYDVISYRPQTSLEEALRRTIEDFKSSGNKWCWQ